MFEGTHTALVTPFLDGQFDADAFRELIEFQIAGGVSGIVPVGTTGESPTLSHEEHLAVIRVAVEAVAGRCLVIAGAGSNSTREAIDLSVEAEKLGADAILSVAPYYNKPSPEGVYRHFRAVAEAVQVPVVLYSIPGRCGIEITVETAARLAADCPNIRAIKESGGSMDRVNQIRLRTPEAFEILSGDDYATLQFLAAGAVGVVSVASNLIPREISHLVAAWLAGKPAGAQKIHFKYYRLFHDLFIEPNPVPTKFALAELGRMSSEVRLPLCPMSPANEERTLASLRAHGILPA